MAPRPGTTTRSRGEGTILTTYSRLCAEFYDLSKPQAPPEALAFYLRHLEDAAEPVLEPMCGSGRFLIPLLERGIDITGVDASPHMLEACHRHCRDKGLTPTLYQQPLQELDLPRQFGYAFIPAGSFGLIADRADAAEALGRLQRHLLPGGKLVLEIETPNARPRSPGKWHEFRLARPDGAELVFRALPAYSAREQLQRDAHCYSLFQDGHLIASEAEELSLRFYRPEQFARLLSETGFTAIKATRAYSKVPPQANDEVVIFECRRPAVDG